MFVFIIGTLEFVIFELYIAYHGFYHFNNYVDRHAKSTSFNSRMIGSFKISFLSRFHFQAKLMEHACDEAFMYFLPFLLLFGGSILISTSFGTIRLHDVIPMPVYLGLPCLSVTVLVVVVTLFPAATTVHDHSCRLLRNVGAMFSRNGTWQGC